MGHRKQLKDFRKYEWSVVTRIYNEQFGTNLCRQTIQQKHDRAVEKIRVALEGDPIIRDALEDMGYRRPR